MTDGSQTNSDDLARAQTNKAAADARAAQVAAELAAAQYAEWTSPLSRQQREAAARQAIAQDEATTTSSQQSKISALMPDLSKVTPAATIIQGQQALFGSELARRALHGAVEQIASEIDNAVKDQQCSFLLTASPDLVSSDAVYGEVVGGLQELSASADAILPGASPAESAVQPKVMALAAAGAMAAALPPLMSLLAPQRNLSSFATGADTTAAIALLASALRLSGKTVRIDDFRTVPEGRVDELDAALRQKRTSLVRLKGQFDGERVQSDNRRAGAQAEVDNLTKTLDGLSPSNPSYTNIQTKLEAAVAARDSSADATSQASQRAAAIADLLTSVDSFLTAIHTVPPGAARSAYTVARLRQELHGEAPATRVIYLSAAGGSTDQLLEHRSLGFKDRFESIASVSVSYWLIEPQDGTVVAAGSVGSSSRLKGTIGGSITIEPIDRLSR